mmetsp:Transcript_22958/g.68245  ORF Transcript_22958/g.68245 Transcript_22958/m.68245 type:complete len:185 (-) Transcript_22958:291-845(-)
MNFPASTSNKSRRLGGSSKTPDKGSSVPPRGSISKSATSRAKASAARAKAAEASKDSKDEEKVEVASFKGLFNKDLRIMMFGFGDDASPMDETVDLVEDIVLEYLTEVTLRAASTAADAHKPRIDEKDLLFIVRKEPAKFARMRELLTMRTLISEARKAMDAPLDEVADAAAATAPGAGAHPPG